MFCQDFSNYCTSTEVYDALKIYMDMDFDGLRSDIMHMPGGEHVSVNTHSFRNDMRTFASKDDVLTLLIHLGYLAYDAKQKETFIPNREIIEEFENAVSVGGWSEVMRVLKASEKLLEDTLCGNADSVSLPLLHTNKPALVVEPKYAETAETALQQIKDGHYTQALEGYSGGILLVGINYDKDRRSKPYSCLIDKA